MESAPPPPSPPTIPPPRAFTQGLGLVFQVVGVLLFLAVSFICCGSGLLSKDYATKTNLTHIGWHAATDAPDQPTYSAQRALTICVFCGIFFGMALAGVGLGMQAERRGAASGAVLLTAIGTIFWLTHALFAASAVHSVLFTIVASLLTILFAILLALSFNAAMETRRDPPPAGHELLPAGYKIPYSHYHDDPPEVRLAAELVQRRERLAVQQKELELLEAKIKRKLDQASDQEK